MHTAPLGLAGNPFFERLGANKKSRRAEGADGIRSQQDYWGQETFRLPFIPACSWPGTWQMKV